MRISSSKTLLAVPVLILPRIAYAQYVPPLLAALALSPLLVLLLAVVLGIVSRSWLVGAKHAGLVLVWIVMFVIASYWVENDYVIWTPLALYGAHAIAMIILIVKGVLSRML